MNLIYESVPTAKVQQKRKSTLLAVSCTHRLFKEVERQQNIWKLVRQQYVGPPFSVSYNTNPNFIA